MAINLVVTMPFGDYAVGDAIADPATIEAVRAAHAQHVVAVSVPNPAPPAPAKDAKGS